MTDSGRAGRGRPLRFLLLFLLGWSAVRAVMHRDIATPGHPTAPRPAGISMPGAGIIGAASALPVIPATTPAAAPRAIRPAAPIRRAKPLRPTPPADSVTVTLTDFLAPSLPFADPPRAEWHGTAPGPIPWPPAPASRTHDGKWRASGWLLWRDGGGQRADYVQPGRLGGSQAGLRLDADLSSRGGGALRAYARASGALDSPAAPEGALGLAFQPARRVPVSLALERRIALGNGARDAVAFVAAGGFGPMALLPAIEAEGYAQTGFVGLRSTDFFLDGKISAFVLKPTHRLRLGASLSGGAQPDVSRLDIGPEMQVRLPAAPLASRLSVEWRTRISGNAAPRSGLAVTLATDF